MDLLKMLASFLVWLVDFIALANFLLVSLILLCSAFDAAIQSGAICTPNVRCGSSHSFCTICAGCPVVLSVMRMSASISSIVARYGSPVGSKHQCMM